MEVLRRPSGAQPSRIGLLPGAFNPPTRAHRALADRAFEHVDEVVWVAPRAYPHKPFEGATFDERLAMMERAARGHAIAVSEGGLFVEMARECRAVYGETTDIWIVCGRDAAERILTWDYGTAGTVEEMLREFGLLVAPRGGPLQPPAALESRIVHLDLPEAIDEISSSEVRRRIAEDEPWEHLVDDQVRDLAARIYRRE